MALQCETSIRNREGATGRPEEKLSPEILAEPCLECHSCKQALGNNQPDIIYLTHEKPNTISVADIREQINHDIEIKPYSSKYKVYIVDEAEKMNQQAQNALLKTIEEPPAYAVILLLTTNADAFLQTIRSRCVMPVSYTHLDVYKRQFSARTNLYSPFSSFTRSPPAPQTAHSNGNSIPSQCLSPL